MVVPKSEKTLSASMKRALRKMVGGGDKKFSREYPDEKKDKHYFNDGVGTPGDFRFSDVPKPEDYLHTFEPICFLFFVFLALYRFLK